MVDAAEAIKLATKGDDYPAMEDRLPSAGIHLGRHGNAIEVYAATLEDAQAIRDAVLEVITKSND